MAFVLHLISFVTGWLVSVRLPAPLSNALIRAYVSILKVNGSEAARPLVSYATLGDFFIRDLKHGVRPLGEGFVSPVDGTLRAEGPIQSGIIPGVKGVDYTVADFISDPEIAQQLASGYYYNLYLSPKDYHHIHFPVSGLVGECSHAPGLLWPVNDPALSYIPKLFAKNERATTIFKHEKLGIVALVMVGALNVGKMGLHYAPGFIESHYPGFLRGSKTTRVRTFEPSLQKEKGDKLGVFHLGSSVVILIQNASCLQLPSGAKTGQRSVRLGETLAEIR